MGDAHGSTKENLLFAFPVGLRENPSIAALGDMTAEALSKRPAEISRLSLYPRVDELPEDLLDILAYDFKVDWWDPNYSLEEKRKVFKDNWYVHKHMGTRAAVETAIRAIYPVTTVEEWFEYEGGQPYHFRLRITITSEPGDLVRQRRVLERVWFYKNLRSHVDGLTYAYEKKTGVRTGACCESTCHLEVWPRLATGVEGTARTGTAQFHESANLLGVWPHLTTGAEGTVRTGAAPFHKTALRQETAPKLPASVRIRSAAGGAAAFTKQTVEIFPLKE